MTLQMLDLLYHLQKESSLSGGLPSNSSLTVFKSVIQFPCPYQSRKCFIVAVFVFSLPCVHNNVFDSEPKDVNWGYCDKQV